MRAPRISRKPVLSQTRSLFHLTLISFLIAGHESSSLAATWCIYALACAPRIQSKLRGELSAVQTDAPSMDELLALPYLDCVVRETLRFHAPVTFTLRAANADDAIPTSEPYKDRNGFLHHEIR